GALHPGQHPRRNAPTPGDLHSDHLWDDRRIQQGEPQNGRSGPGQKNQDHPMRQFKKIGALLALLLGCGPLSAFQAPLDTQDFEKRLAEEMQRYQAVGLAVAVVKDDRMIYNNSFGWKDLQAKIPLEKD